MRRQIPLFFALASMAAIAVASPAMVPPTARVASEPAVKPTRKRRSANVVRSWDKPLRSRGPSAPRKKKSNRMHVSKRVRLKHRKAA